MANKERKGNEHFEANVFTLLAFKAIVNKNFSMIVLGNEDYIT